MHSLMKQSSLMKLCNVVNGASVGMSLMACNMLFALAANPWSGAESTLSTLFNDLRASLLKIVVPIAGCALVFCLIMMFVTSSQRKHEAYRSWAITIFLCLVGIFAIDFFLDLAETIGSSLAGSSSSGP